jgi:hypothetical protein
MVLWDLTGIVPLAELVGGLAVLFEVSPALTEKASMDHAAVDSIMTWFLAPLTCFVVSSGVGYCAIH